MSGDLLTIGEVATRSGVATSALRFYEERGLITSERTEGNQRRFHRSELRRVSVIRAAQAVGLTLAEIADHLAALPSGRTPTVADWARMSATWRSMLDERIATTERLRDNLDGCIGCGCLSLTKCTLFNPGDVAAATGDGPRYVLEASPDPDDDGRGLR